MKPADEARIAARLAQLMAMICVRNTGIEELHAGTVPVTHASDYSDVFITDADGRQIPWTDAPCWGTDNGPAPRNLASGKRVRAVA